MTDCIPQLRLEFHPDRPVDVRFNAPESSSDGGWLLLRKVDDRLGLSEGLASLVPDDRDPSRVKHPRREQIRQRLFQIAAGYEDCNDADSLRQDSLLKTCCDRLPEDPEGLSSQPTFSRLENAVGMGRIRELVCFLEDTYVASLPDDTECVVLDIDGFNDPTYGAQQLTLFSGYYRQYMYFPLPIFDGEGQLVTVILRPGTVRDHRGALGLLERVIRKLKGRLPEVAVVVRADSHFATPRIMSRLEQLDAELGQVDYLFGLRKNSRLETLLAPAMARARAENETTGRPARILIDFRYKTKKSWPRERHVVGSALYSTQGENPRFVVTSLSGFPPASLYRAYCHRGQAENHIKEFKNSVQADRLSCSTFAANFFRLVLHAAVYRLLFTLRQALSKVSPGLARCCFDTLRLRLLKVAAIVSQSVRRVLIRLPAAFPQAKVFRAVAAQLSLHGPSP